MKRHRTNRLAKKRANPITHLSGGRYGVGEGEHVFRARVSLFDEACNPVDQDRGFPRAGTRDHQHRPMKMFDRFTLPIVGSERRRMRV